MIVAILRTFVRLCLSLRYRIGVRGAREIASRGREGILFLPNHPALIDPIILMASLHKTFRPRALADEEQIDRFFIRTLAARAGVLPIPDPSRHGAASREHIERELDACIALLRRGENVLLYPAGQLCRGRLEDLGGNSAVERILRELPSVRVVLVRTTGLWGSAFSWASGREPKVAPVLKRGLLRLLASGVFFAPRRPVRIELHEPDDLPRAAGRNEINRYLEAFYRADAPPNTFVPYTPWNRRGTRQLPEPPAVSRAPTTEQIPPATRRIVADFLRELSGVETFGDETRLAHDLGLDSLARGELLLFLEKEFGFPQGDVNSLQTVGDVLLAACGQSASAGPVELAPVPPAWFAPAPHTRLRCGQAEHLGQLFVAQALTHPHRAVLADQAGGVKTFRDIATAVLLLKREIEKLPGESVGILLPASAASGAAYLGAMFAGKTPVMVNWTVGRRNLGASLRTAGVRAVLTSRRMIERLGAQGIALDDLPVEMVYLEALAARMGRLAKLRAALAARGSLRALRDATISPVAAVLFTSGSETIPKAVPLTHANLLANLRDVTGVAELFADDRLMGILPPFHSFGLTVGLCAPLCLGLPAVYHPNPAEGPAIARLAGAYRPTLLVGTPTFLSGIARGASPGQLDSLRLIVTGAEQCPRRVYELLAERCPAATTVEGYGVTECSPIVAVNDPRAPRAGTIGQLLPSLEHAIVDVETGTPVAPGQAGVLLVRGPSVFGGYLGEAPDPFVEFDGKRWYRTGDLVSEDPEGVLTFRGRLKRFAKIGGEMISLPAIEAVLAENFASPDAEGPTLAVEAVGEEGRPELVLFTTLDLDRDEVNRRLRDAGLSPLHFVRRVEKLAEIPTLGTGKTDYRELRRRMS
ncbi:MAG TPA: AMP-binding protein [Phycisphaerae bacterium]|nr:AMP-binding protein [Phycisphaerae bacterium]